VIIETRGLEKHYRRAAAVNGLDLRVPEGSISGFLGPNGSGKTTTIKMLLGLVRPTEGEGFVFGNSITDCNANLEIRRRVGYVSEDKRLYAYMTVQQLLDFTRPLFAGWSRERELALLEEFPLPLDRKFKALSRGMRTQLALVLALARRPDLLILDEPSEGLDPVVIEKMLAAVVRAASEGATVFFSTHQLSEVQRIADHVFMIRAGRLVFEGSMERLRANVRRVNVVFRNNAPTEEMRIDGVCGMRSQGRLLSIVIDSNLEAITARAQSLGALSIDVQPMDLRELFLDRMQGEAS
jgi:ABC-2 type transport system ATP-binding protein